MAILHIYGVPPQNRGSQGIGQNASRAKVTYLTLPTLLTLLSLAWLRRCVWGGWGAKRQGGSGAKRPSCSEGALDGHFACLWGFPAKGEKGGN